MQNDFCRWAVQILSCWFSSFSLHSESKRTEDYYKRKKLKCFKVLKLTTATVPTIDMILILVFKLFFVHLFGCHLVMFYAYLAAHLPWFVVLQISLDFTFFVTQLPSEKFRSWLGRAYLITCSPSSQNESPWICAEYICFINQACCQDGWILAEFFYRVWTETSPLVFSQNSGLWNIICFTCLDQLFMITKRVSSASFNSFFTLKIIIQFYTFDTIYRWKGWLWNSWLVCEIVYSVGQGNFTFVRETSGSFKNLWLWQLWQRVFWYQPLTVLSSLHLDKNSAKALINAEARETNVGKGK